MNSPPVGFHTPPPHAPRMSQNRPARSRKHQVVPPDVLFAQGVARLAGIAAQSAQAPNPGPEPGAPEGSNRLSHHSARARVMLGLRRLYRSAKPVLAPIFGRIAQTLRGILD